MTDQMPKKFFQEFLSKYLRNKAIIDRFEDIELIVIAEFLLFNLIFIQEELNASIFKTTVLMNIFLQLISHNNQKFDNKGEKTKESDYLNFKQLLIDHSSDKKPQQMNILNDLEIEKILAYTKKTQSIQISYFDFYEMYQKINKAKKKQQFNIYFVVDEPQQVPPLKEALYMGNPKIQVQLMEDQEEEEIEQQYSLDIQQSQKDMSQEFTLQEDNNNELVKEQVERKMAEFEQDYLKKIEIENQRLFQKAQIA